MGKRSEPGTLPSAEHTWRDGVEGKACRGKFSRGTEHWCPLQEYWSNIAYADGRAETCRTCYSQRRRERDAAEKPESESTTLILSDPRPVIFDDLGTRALVGWHGSAEYFPITPLVGLTRFDTERGLREAIENDPLMSTLRKIFSVSLPTSKQARQMWHLPWSHFSAFCIKFGNEQTKPQQDRAQRVLEMAFGHTAESNLEGAARIDQGDQLAWEDNRQRHDKTHKLLTDMRDDLRGATLYKDRILVIRGSVYFTRLWPEMPLESVISLIDIPSASEMWRKGYRLYSIGKTSKRTEARLDNYAKKMRMKPPVPIAELHVDDPDEAERLLKKLRPTDAIPIEGCAEQFWCKPTIEERVRRSWSKNPTMAIEDLAIRMRGWEIGEPVRIDQHSIPF